MAGLFVGNLLAFIGACSVDDVETDDVTIVDNSVEGLVTDDVVATVGGLHLVCVLDNGIGGLQ